MGLWINFSLQHIYIAIFVRDVTFKYDIWSASTIFFFYLPKKKKYIKHKYILVKQFSANISLRARFNTYKIIAFRRVHGDKG